MALLLSLVHTQYPLGSLVAAMRWSYGIVYTRQDLVYNSLACGSLSTSSLISATHFSAVVSPKSIEESQGCIKSSGIGQYHIPSLGPMCLSIVLRALKSSWNASLATSPITELRKTDWSATWKRAVSYKQRCLVSGYTSSTMLHQQKPFLELDT